METQNLRTASDYINNLLLARGLLRNGKPLDFAEPADDSGSTDATMARVINLVHDLVLRRDRDAEQRENLASTVRNLRATEAKQTVEIESCQAKASDLSRSLAIAEGQERAFKITIRNAEATIRGLKEQMQRMKTTLQQVRSQCATDIRKRDIELQKLKSHLTDRQRGKRDGVGVTTITITPTPKPSLTKPVEGGSGLDSPGYSLKQETTEFLTRLCQDLSDENDALIAIVKSSIQTLKSLQGLPDSDPNEADVHDQTQENTQLSTNSEQPPISAPPPEYETLSIEMEHVLDQLRELLTNPSFVPLEEVEMRENEIYRLRDNWEKMEGRWREAIAMMDGWHKRLAEGGDSVNIDELQRGMGLGLGIDEQIPASKRDDDKDRNSSKKSAKHWDSDFAGSKGSPDSRKRKTPLEEQSGNARPSSSRRNVTFASESSESSEESEDELVSIDKPDSAKRRRTQTHERAESKVSKIPRQAPKAAVDLTVAKKLANAKSEAQKVGESKKRTVSARDQKRKAGRRRSTLTSAELDELIGVDS